jgi:hypothetical protein
MVQRTQETPEEVPVAFIQKTVYLLLLKYPGRGVANKTRSTYRDNPWP